MQTTTLTRGPALLADARRRMTMTAGVMWNRSYPKCTRLESLVEDALARLRDRLSPPPPPLPLAEALVDEDANDEEEAPYGQEIDRRQVPAPVPVPVTIVAQAPEPAPAPVASEEPAAPVLAQAPQKVEVAEAPPTPQPAPKLPLPAEVPELPPVAVQAPAPVAMPAAAEPSVDVVVLAAEIKDEPTQEPAADVVVAAAEIKDEPTEEPVADASAAENEDEPAEEEEKEDEEEEEEEEAKEKPKKVLSGKDFVDDECEASSDDEPEVDELGGEPLDAHGNLMKPREDGTWGTFVVPDDEVVEELMDSADEEREICESVEPKKKKHLVKNDGAESKKTTAPAAAAASSPVKSEVEAKVGAFFDGFGDDAVAARKKQRIIQCVLEEKQKLTTAQKRNKGEGNDSAQVSDGNTEGGKKPRAPKPYLATYMTEELFCDIGLVTAFISGYTQCYGSERRALYAFRTFLDTEKGGGKELSVLQMRIRKKRKEESEARDLETIKRLFASPTAASVPAKKRPNPEVLNTLQVLALNFGNAASAEMFGVPEGGLNEALIETACPGFTVRPRQMTFARADTKNGDYVVTPATVIVPPNIAALLDRVHCILQVDSFIQRSEDIVKWTANNRPAFEANSKLPDVARKELAPTLGSLWKEWCDRRRAFCAEFSEPE